MTSESGKTIVIAVGMFDSVHFAKWLELFRDEPIDFLLFPSSPNRSIHAQLRTLVDRQSTATYRYAFNLAAVLSLPLWLIDRIAQDRLRGYLLRRLIKRHGPNFVHALGIQSAGYILLSALGKSDERGRPKIIVTNYGSDIFWFARFEKHKAKIRRLLEMADTYACECQRDVSLAQSLGFRGRIMPVHPNAGGFSKAELEHPLSELPARSTIAVKGYQGWVGRAALAIEALELIHSQVSHFEIEIYSCNAITVRLARKLSRRTGLKVIAHRKHALTHTEVLEMFRRSIVYVGISESDGISTSLLEAMACGAIPVQTSTACCDEWFTETGVRVETISPQEIAKSILLALRIAENPENRGVNWRTISKRASQARIQASALQYYQ